MNIEINLLKQGNFIFDLVAEEVFAYFCTKSEGNIEGTKVVEYDLVNLPKKTIIKISETYRYNAEKKFNPFENKDYTVLEEERSLTEKECSFFSSLYETKKLEVERLNKDFFTPLYRVIFP